MFLENVWGKILAILSQLQCVNASLYGVFECTTKHVLV